MNLLNVDFENYVILYIVSTALLIHSSWLYTNPSGGSSYMHVLLVCIHGMHPLLSASAQLKVQPSVHVAAPG